NDIDREIGIRRQQFREKDTRMSLQMGEHERFLCFVWRNLMRPEILQKLQILNLKRPKLSGRAEVVGQSKLLSIPLSRRTTPLSIRRRLITSGLSFCQGSQRLLLLPFFPACRLAAEHKEVWGVPLSCPAA